MLDRAVAYRDEYGFDDDEPAPGLFGRMLAAMARRPARTAAIGLVVIASAVIVANATFFQSGEHPSPFFATRDGDAGTPVAETAANNAAPATDGQSPDHIDEIGRLVEVANVGAPAIEGAPASVSVVQVQSLLTALGYDAGTIDGLFGTRTRAAIEAFERDHGLTTTGAVSADLLSALEEAAAAQPEPPTVVAGDEATILAVQSALNRTGYGPVPTDGELSSATAEGIRSFQLDYGMTITGEIDDALIARMVSIGALELP